jgi:hypothetical protein
VRKRRDTLVGNDGRPHPVRLTKILQDHPTLVDLISKLGKVHPLKSLGGIRVGSKNLVGGKDLTTGDLHVVQCGKDGQLAVIDDTPILPSSHIGP